MPRDRTGGSSATRTGNEVDLTALELEWAAVAGQDAQADDGALPMKSIRKVLGCSLPTARKRVGEMIEAGTVEFVERRAGTDMTGKRVTRPYYRIVGKRG